MGPLILGHASARLQLPARPASAFEPVEEVADYGRDDVRILDHVVVVIESSPTKGVELRQAQRRARGDGGQNCFPSPSSIGHDMRYARLEPFLGPDRSQVAHTTTATIPPR